MKKYYFLIVLALILGLALAGCTFLSNIGQAPATEQSGIAYLTKAMLSPNDLVGLWHFDGDADDSSANENDGTVSGATYVDSPMGQALSLDGTSDYVEVADSPSLDVTGELTIEAWVRANVTISGTTQMQIVDKGEHTSSSGYMLMIYNGDLYGRVNKAGITATIYGPYPDDGEWHHVAYTFKSGEQKLYIDESEVKSNTGTATIITNNYPLLIGMGVNRPQYSWNGLIDEVRIWKVALSSEQLGEVYSFVGFHPPVENIPTRNVVKAGRAIPVKFSLTGDQGLNIFEDGYPKSWIISCSDGTDPVGYIEDTVNAAGGSSLSYDGVADQYIYIWKTEKNWANTCRKLVVLLNDGTYHEAYFTFK